MHAPRPPLVIGHRGDPLASRENTVASVEAAVLAGADAVEVDVQLAATARSSRSTTTPSSGSGATPGRSPR